MTIRYAGIDLLLEDPEGNVRTWLDRHLSELSASIFCPDQPGAKEVRFASVLNSGLPIVAETSSSGFPATDTQTVRRVGLPVGNYPRQPRPRINSLYWPTGATRWACGLFLIPHANLASVLDACAGEQSQVFELVADTGVAVSTGGSGSSGGGGFVGETTAGISASMFALAPRPISAQGVNPDDQLWLLPLVDARYFWQYYHVGQYTPSTWAEALSLVKGVSPTDTPTLGEAVPSAYGRPSATEFVRDFENVATLVDASALSIGRRVVGNPQINSYKFQPYQTQTAAAAKTIANANLASGWDIVAGGEFSAQATTLGNIPASLVVTFASAGRDRVGGYSEYDKSGTTNGGTKAFHCSATGSGSVPPTGKYTSGFEQALVNQLAADYYEWLTLHYDVTFAGIVPWRVTGFDDYVRWDIDVHGKGRRRRYRCQTRAVSMPPNFGFEALPLDPLGSSSSSSSVSSSSPSSPSSQSSQSSESSSPSSSPTSSSNESSSDSGTNSSNTNSNTSSGFSRSSSSSRSSSRSSNVSSGGSNSNASSGSNSSGGSGNPCKCGTSTYISDGTFWTTVSHNCTGEGTPVRPSIRPGPAGMTIDVCCNCGSSNDSSSGSSTSSDSSATSETSSNSSGSGSGGGSNQSSTTSNGSESESSQFSESSESSNTSGSSNASSGGNNNTSDSGSGGGSGNGSETSSGGSHTTSSDGSGTSSGGGSGNSSGASNASNGSNESNTSGSSGNDDGCSDVVTDVSCGPDGLSVTKVRARITLC